MVIVIYSTDGNITRQEKWYKFSQLQTRDEQYCEKIRSKPLSRTVDTSPAKPVETIKIEKVVRN